jgi:hypothetical protein
MTPMTPPTDSLPGAATVDEVGGLGQRLLGLALVIVLRRLGT